MRELKVCATSVEEVLRIAADGRLFAILDACDTPSVPEMADRLGESRAVSLYLGSADEELWAIAPYLFRADPPLVAWVAETLWPEPWGVLLESAAPFEEVRRHLRKFLIVHDSKGERLYFRYYDPRVLRTFLRSATGSELDEFFESLRTFFVPVAPDRPALEAFSLDGAAAPAAGGRS